jgi:hypothetical protein
MSSIIMIMGNALTSNVDHRIWRIVWPLIFAMTCLTKEKALYFEGCLDEDAVAFLAIDTRNG